MTEETNQTKPIRRTWTETIMALEDDYTLSIRDVCHLVKASRQWVNKYIRPHVDVIYLSSGKRGEYNTGRDWVKMAAQILNREDMTESIWFHKGQLYELLKRSVVSVTKQTKDVPITALMAEADRPRYRKEKEEIFKRLSEADKANDKEEFRRLNAEMLGLNAKYIDQAGLDLLEQRASIVKRGAVPRIDVPYPGEFDPSIWVSCSDIKDYGDTDEDIYRWLFSTGAIRIELAFSDVNGEIGTKIYYVPDPEPIPNIEDDINYPIPEGLWQEYKASRGN